jgi:TIR domain
MASRKHPALPHFLAAGFMDLRRYLVTMPDWRTVLFLSHAWEDKESLVESLYQALKDEYDVWYDIARITLGDSIYEKISEGIREYLTIGELKAKWPIEAGKLAISNSEGIPAIVQAIHFAVGADRENKDFAKDALNKAFGDFHTAKQLAKINDDLSKVREGAVKAEDAAVELLGLVKERVDELSAGSDVMTATLYPRSDRHLVTLRTGEYRMVIEYLNPVWKNQIKHLRFPKDINESMPWFTATLAVSTTGQTLDAQLEQLRVEDLPREAERRRLRPTRAAEAPQRHWARRRGDCDSDRPPRPLDLRPVRYRQTYRGRRRAVPLTGRAVGQHRYEHRPADDCRPGRACSEK